MATDIVGGLFGITPEMYQREQNQQALAQSAQLAQLDPFASARTSLIYGGRQLGGAIAGALGAEDPQLQRISQFQNLAGQADLTTPEGYATLGQQLLQRGDTARGMELIRRSQEMVGELAKTRLATAQTQKAELSIAQEEKLRSKLANLGPNATQADILKTVTEFGSPDKILATLEGSSRATEANQTRLQIAEGNQTTQLAIAKQNADARIEAARMQGATALQIAQMKTESNAMIAQMKNDLGYATLQIKRQLLASQPLNPTLQKEETNDLKAIDNLDAQVTSLAPIIKNLQVDPQTGKASLELGPINNKKYELANATGKSTPESLAYANLQTALQSAINIKTEAAKGVQTDKDVLRFANEFTAAFAKNDTRATLQSVSNFVDASKTAQVKLMDIIEKRRFAQGVSPYGGGKAPSPSTGSDQDLINKYTNPK